MAMSGGKDDGEPMMEMNTTPLIDVMLVLLIMFIITIPVATHAVNIDLPSPNSPPPLTKIERTKNQVTITPQGVVLWNGTPLNNAQLVGALNQTMAMKPEPELDFQPDAQAPYDMAAKVLNIIKASGVTAFGFVGNEQYYQFGKEAGAPPAKM
jgi:biopolymer transport protein ExbD